MEIFPKDMIFQLALECDLSTMGNFCRASKRINNIVCNNDIFWVNKLKKDFGIIYSKPSEAKSYYKEVSFFIKENPDPNGLYSKAICTNSLDVVKIALNRGADINGDSKTEIPLVTALILEHFEIFNYILEKDPFNSLYNTMGIIRKIVNYIEKYENGQTNRIIVTTALFDKILPKVYTKIARKKVYRKFWSCVAIALERNREFLPEVYDRRIKELNSLASLNKL